jgi:hypothetical protein
VSCYTDSCFIHCMIKSYLFNDSEINSVKAMVTSDMVPLAKIKIICEKFDFMVQIRKKSTRKDRNVDLQYINKQTKSGRILKICLLNEHYFIDEKINISSYSIKNYHDVKHLDEWNWVINDKHKIDRRKSIGSFEVVRLLLENEDKLLRPLLSSVAILESNRFKEFKHDFNDLSFDKLLCCKKKMYIEPEKINLKWSPENTMVTSIYFADFETTTDGDKHVPYWLCCSNILDPDDQVKSYKGDPKYFINKWLDDLEHNSIVYFHNLGYDFRFFISYLTCVTKIIEKSSTKCILLSGIYKKKKISFKCSYALITMGLAEFGKTFGLNVCKEIMPYSCYTEETVKQRFIPIGKAVSGLHGNQSKIDGFLDNIEKWNLIKPDEKFDHMKYCQIYCEMDVITLKNGFKTFRGWIQDQLNMDVVNYVTLASLSDSYMAKTGCYEHCYQVSSLPRIFMQKCIVGGRTMSCDNEKAVVNDELNDFDAVSLYPSAITRLADDLGGYLKGLPNILLPEQLNMKFLNSIDGYFLKINITKNSINRSFPLLNKHNKEGIRQFTNESIGEYFIDRIALEDLIKFHNIDFEIISGLYFNSGRNPQCGKTMRYLFNKRVELKDQNNPAQMIYKLIMNTAYGKAILKPISEETLVMNVERFDVYLKENYNYITYYAPVPCIGETRLIKVKVTKPIIDHYNYCHIGSEILSMSKRIMNEVMTLAEDESIKLYYQDTDSIHIKDSDVNQLADNYYKKYNKVLIGKNMGQFHCDFSVSDKELDKKKPITSVKCIILGKKAYIDQLKYTTKDNKTKYDYHIRLKGIPNSVINYKVKHEYNDDPMKMFQDLYDKKAINFDMLSGGGCKFEGHKDFSMTNRERFSRVVKF